MFASVSAGGDLRADEFVRKEISNVYCPFFSTIGVFYNINQLQSSFVGTGTDLCIFEKMEIVPQVRQPH